PPQFHQPNSLGNQGILIPIGLAFFAVVSKSAACDPPAAEIPPHFLLHCAIAALLPAVAHAQNNTSIHTSWLWHLHQPIYWPEKRAGSDHYENAWDTIQAQGAGRSHPVEQVRGQVFDIDDRRAAYQCRPHDALASIGQYVKSGAQLNYSGALMENVQSLGAAGQLGYASNWYQSNKDAKGWTTSGGKSRVDLTNFSYHHALAPFLSDETLELELRIHKRQMQLLWGDPTSHGYFPAEACFSERMIPILNKIDIAWTVIANNHLARACSDFPLVIGS